MDQTITINELSPKEQQALTCLYFAMLKKDDPRYKKMQECFRTFERQSNLKYSAYKHSKDKYEAVIADHGNTVIEFQPQEYQTVYDKYKNCPVDVLEDAVMDIMKQYSEESASYISMKCGFVETVHKILKGDKEITIDGVYTLQEKLTAGRIVFITIGGDIGKKEVDWKPGFVGIGHVVKPPYDSGYNGTEKYFKFDLYVDIIFKNVYRREDFINYEDAFDAPYIGPELSRDPSQALSSLTDSKAVAVIRGVLDKEPELQEDFRRVFPDEFMSRVLGAVRMLIPASVIYGENIKEAVIDTIDSESDAEDTENVSDKEASPNENVRLRNGTNILLYGVPGCGKSYRIKTRYCTNESVMERIVFHPDYTNSDFIGQILPQNNNGNISYHFVPGPFTRIMRKAYWNPNVMHYLVIEEINRGNAPAIFGEVFQLLDRENGESTYGINNADLAREIYLKNGQKASDEDKEKAERRPVKIPSNLTVLATMNTADQNVFTLDTAFKRRWSMQCVPNDFTSCEFKDEPIGNTQIRWRVFAGEINKAIAGKEASSISSEDKRLGAYFISPNELKDNRKFAEKVLAYLWDDVFKYDRPKVFRGDIQTLDELVNTFEIEGLDAFDGVMKSTLQKYNSPDEEEYKTAD